MNTAVDLLLYMQDLIDSQCYDGHWTTPSGSLVPCDVSEVSSWFYGIFLPDLFKKENLTDDLRSFVESL